MDNFPHIPTNQFTFANRKPIYGVGTNDADYMVQPRVNGKSIKCPVYQTWMNLLERCYSKEYHAKQPTYIGCTVAQEWLQFTNFRSWMTKQDWKGKQIDKDLLVLGNKHYSPETCLFVTQAINLLFADRKADQGEWPQGVTQCIRNGKFISRITICGETKFLGRFDSPLKAGAAYAAERSAYIKRIALNEPEPLRSALLRHTARMLRPDLPE